MANDKRHPMSTDMNDTDLNDPEVMTDQEREKLQEALDSADKKSQKRKETK